MNEGDFLRIFHIKSRLYISGLLFICPFFSTQQLHDLRPRQRQVISLYSDITMKDHKALTVIKEADKINHS